VSALIAALAIGCTSTGDDLFDKPPDASPFDAIVIGDADTTDAHIGDASPTDAALPDAVAPADAADVADALPTTD
jgi:hypothetical protein